MVPLPYRDLGCPRTWGRSACSRLAGPLDQTVVIAVWCLPAHR